VLNGIPVNTSHQQEFKGIKAKTVIGGEWENIGIAFIIVQ
jgi:hypothetical protein